MRNLLRGLEGVHNFIDDILVHTTSWEKKTSKYFGSFSNDSATQTIREATRRQTKRQLRSFLGLANYYRKFVPNFAETAVPLTDLTKKGEPNTLNWGTGVQESQS